LQVELVDELTIYSRVRISFRCIRRSRETHHFLDLVRLQKTSTGPHHQLRRGGLIDEAASSKRFKIDMWPRGLDVFETEPLPADSPLRGAPILFSLRTAEHDIQRSAGKRRIEIAHRCRVRSENKIGRAA